MQFNVMEWRKIYNKVKVKGQIIKESYPYIDDDHNLCPPLNPIPVNQRKKIEEEIKYLLDQSKRLLNSAGIKPKPPLWIYDPKDVTTWPSDQRFKYKNLL
jgi:hypothetical protein